MPSRVSEEDTKMTDTTARDARIAALLRKAANELDPSTTRVTKAAPKAAKTTSTPPAAQGDTSCVGCGKALLRVNALCKKCAKAGTTEVKTSTGTSRRLNTPEAVKAAKVAAKVAPEAPAKALGRREAKAHCSTVGCGLFVKAGATVCTKHTTKKVAAAVGAFVTLEDGKRGYRVPADMVVALRKQGVEDSLILSAAKAKGLGQKVSKASTSL